MLNRVKVSIVALVFTLGFAGAPAFAQNQGGLVNVNISGNNIAVPISVAAALNIAANVCKVDVTVIGADLEDDGTATCINEQSGKAVTLTKVVQQQ